MKYITPTDHGSPAVAWSVQIERERLIESSNRAVLNRACSNGNSDAKGMQAGLVFMIDKSGTHVGGLSDVRRQ